MATTVLGADSILPLTCTRSGTCCHGKVVWLNPWELASLARARGMTARDFRERHTEGGGIRLRFDGEHGWKGLRACSLYAPGSGCTAHAGRPLACRLYPLGRERQRDQVRYVHEGRRFPCLEGCPEVRALPHLTVADYLAGQGTIPGEAVQDAYLEVMQDLAEGAFVVLFDSGLAAGGDRETLPRWLALARLDPGARAAEIEPPWLDRLTLPEGDADDAPAFVAGHREALRREAQAAFAAAADPAALRAGSCLLMGLALHLATSLGMDPRALVEGFLATARTNGAAG
jgi:Fe-S-cluster containining protein